MNADASPPTVLHAEGLCLAYPGRVLFQDWSVRLRPGVTLVCGEESCGKSSLLRLLAGALAAQAGTLQVAGIPLATQPERYRAQVFWLDPRSNLWDQVTPHACFQSLAQQYPSFERRRVLDLAAQLGLTPHLDKPMYMLSTGSKRKVWLAAALASGAAVTLLDEPFAALDQASIRCVLALLQEAAAHPGRAWVLADYTAPPGVPLADVITLVP